MGSMQAGQNVVAQKYYDPQRGVWQDVPEAALEGAVAGGLIHGVTEGFHAARTALQNVADARAAQEGAPMPETQARQAYATLTARQTAPGGPYGAPAADDGGGGGGGGGVRGVVVDPDFAPPQLGPDGVPISAGGQAVSTPGGTRIGGRRGANAGVETLIPGQGNDANSADSIPQAPPPDYERARASEGAPIERMPDAIADVEAARAAPPQGPNLFKPCGSSVGSRTAIQPGRWTATSWGRSESAAFRRA